MMMPKFAGLLAAAALAPAVAADTKACAATTVTSGSSRQAICSATFARASDIQTLQIKAVTHHFLGFCSSVEFVVEAAGQSKDMHIGDGATASVALGAAALNLGFVDVVVHDVTVEHWYDVLCPNADLSATITYIDHPTPAPPTPIPTTAAPLTPAPTTLAPATPTPTTATPVPATSAPTQKPATPAPTPAPTTQTPAPATPAPTTPAPHTRAPKTHAPTPAPTPAPTTQAPTPAPTTQAPTPAPTTPAPQTLVPQTLVPQTNAPKAVPTPAPLMPAPTTAAPTPPPTGVPEPRTKGAAGPLGLAWWLWGAIGGGALLVLACVLVVCCCCCRKKSPEETALLCTPRGEYSRFVVNTPGSLGQSPKAGLL